jgi:hypothetical protein
MITLHKINEEIENLIQEVRALNKVLFIYKDKKSYKIKQKLDEKWNRINFLKAMRKMYADKK